MAEVHGPFALDDLVRQRRRYEQPAEPQPRREGLADRPRVRDPLGVESLQRADGRAVVAEVAVVVVLDDQPVHGPRPVEEFGAPPRGVGDSGRELVGRRRHHRPYPGRPQRPEGEPLLVQRQRYGAQPGRRVQRRRARGCPGPRRRRSRIPRACSTNPSRVVACATPGDDHEALRVGDHAPAPGEQRGQRGAQPGQSARIGIAQRLVRQLARAPRRWAAAHAARGNSDRSGVPGTKSARRAGGARREVPRARAARPRTAPPTQVPAPRPLRR